MSGALTLFRDLFQPACPDPAVAAAATVLCNAPPLPTPPLGLERALRAVAPHLSDAERASWVTAMTTPLLEAGITTPHRVAAFVGQCALESGGFRDLEEDLSYSAARLCEVWPNRFPTLAAAEAYAMQPEALANCVYAGRMGNGDAASGDGWRFRGRGLIQITGRLAYDHFAKTTGLSLDRAIEQAATQEGAAASATWFWLTNDLNRLADAGSIDLITRKINGGTTDAAERARLYEAALHAIGA
jgi:putative chitinase